MRSRIIRSLAAMFAALSLVLAFLNFPVRAEFEYKPISIFIPFRVTKADVAGGGTYDVVIEPTNDAPQPKDKELTIKGSGSGNFEITAEEPGTYEYKVFERKGSDSNVEYDDTTYKVTVFVTSDDRGNLDYQIILSDGTDVKPTQINFDNTTNFEPTPTKKPSKPDPITRTGETMSKYLPYALAAFGIGGAIIVIVLIRRKRGGAS